MLENTINMKDNTANPGPLGLIGFGLATVLLNLHNAGLFGMDTMILSMGLFMGGILQVIVGMFEWKKNNMFGMIAFTSYGFFWISLIFLLLFPKMELADAPSSVSMGYYLAIWGVFSLGLFVATLKMNNAMKILFASVFGLFALLSIADFTGNSTMKIIAGIEGIICGSIALYVAMAQLLNDTYKKVLLPL